MPELKTKTVFDVNAILHKTNGRLSKAQFWLDNEVAKNSDQFVPFDSGLLAHSVFKSNFGSGKLVYDAPYAAAVYYNVRNVPFRTNIHPKASDHWVMKAKLVYMKHWTEGVNRILAGGNR